MNQEIKAKWVAALRSGKYAQTTHQLKNFVGYCCLGVLGELCALETGFSIVENLKETHGQENLGKTVRAWAELPYDYGDAVTINGIHDLLTTHNDKRFTFAKIADAIEAQL